MKPMIMVNGSDYIISLAKSVLEEMVIPEGIHIQYFNYINESDYGNFFNNLDTYHFNPTRILVCGTETSEFLFDEYGLTSIPIRITGFDILCAIDESLQYASDITIVTFYKGLPDIEQYEKILQKRINQIILPPGKLIKDLMDSLKSSGCKAIIASSLICSIAEQNGIKGVFMYSRAEVYNALKRAVDMISTYLQETERAEMLKTVVDYANSGIIGSGRDFRITTFNPAAEEILGMKARNIIGKPFQEVFPEFSLQKINDEVVPRINELGRINNKTVVYNSLPIDVKGETHGQVTVLHDMVSIRAAEAKIRRDLFQKRFIAKYHFEDIIGRSEVIQKTVKRAMVFAHSDSPILIMGETGTGKELFAQSIHNESHRRENPFVSINCGALTESILDSELFGYEKGAFTGARQEGKVGLFEMAHMGTIFLDEIGDISPSVQIRLLRVLQEREIMRVGGNRFIPVDVRIIAATNTDLWALIEKGKFREDLYYRLNVLELQIPPLRDRLSDIPDLIQSFLKKKARGVKPKIILKLFDSFIKDHLWPGNIRELENLLERFSALASELPSNRESTFDNYRRLFEECIILRRQTNQLMPSSEKNYLKKKKVDTDEIRKMINDMKGNKTQAAKKMGISRTTLYRKIKEHNQQNAEILEKGFSLSM